MSDTSDYGYTVDSNGDKVAEDTSTYTTTSDNTSSTSDSNSSGITLDDIKKLFLGTSSAGTVGQLAAMGGVGALLANLFGGGGGSSSGASGYQGGIPTLTASRQMLPIPTTMTNASGQTVARRPGSGGITYFTPMRYSGSSTTQPAETTAATSTAATPATAATTTTSAATANNNLTDSAEEAEAAHKANLAAQALRDAAKVNTSGAGVVSLIKGLTDQQTNSQTAQVLPKYPDAQYLQPSELVAAVSPQYANGGMTGYASGGIANLGGYSDGGQLLRGPGDGVSDDIPATIGGRQPARLADGEFVVPARIVSELGNGSTEAGARKLYAMMDRIKATRAKAKNIAANTKADKHLPA